MHFGKISLVCLQVTTVAIAEQLVHEPIQANIGKANAFPNTASANVLHPVQSQFENAFQGLHYRQGKKGNRQRNAHSLDHPHLHQMMRAMTNGVSKPNLARLWQQGKAAIGSAESSAEEGLHHVWDEVDDGYHRLSDNIKEKLPTVRADLKKMAPYAAPVGEIMKNLLARDIELEEEIYARGLDWYLDDDE
ncbi:MAG: hypothetical protein GOMPHAMPRED_005048 [Gomphillus americanus]|uniref:RxLR effector protein n=1 Tax=Gomphillus americanus TaxID=1940652 RepID=A0A8H3ENA8_9LECA|nr:MAG: hypothetical protein GOMPHAMPRED_005048 [Gomphillus americanus]